MSNYYQTLGVDRTATPDEIKRAYRRLASQHHPDKGGDKNKFQEIEAAYRTLSDPHLRAQHDNPHRHHFGGHDQHGFNFESIFDIFGARFQHPGMHRQPQRAMMTLWITLREAVVGGRKTVSIGTNQGTQAVEIEIPLGLEDGSNVQYPGIGPQGMDLIVTFRLHPDPKWARNGLNLQTRLNISIWDLILGTETTIRDIIGNTLSLTIPPRTQPGTLLRLRGRGMSARSGEVGDLLVQVQAEIPADIPEALLAQINQIRQQ